MLRITLSAVVCLFVMSGCVQKRAPLQVRQFPVKTPLKKELTAAQKAELEDLLKQAVIHFDFDEATLTPFGRGQLEMVAEALIVRPWASIRVAGHCDERGTVEYNLALGMRRAQVARDYLVRLGVDASAVEVVSYGAELPAVFDDTEDAYAANRRDEMVPQHVDLLGMVK